MSSDQGNAQKAGPQAVEMEGRLLDDIVGAGSEPISFTTYQDRIDASTRHKDAIDQFGPDSPQARDTRARLDDVTSRLHPMDR
jgi:hypothetical protein